MVTIPIHKPAELVEVGEPRAQKLHVASFGDGGTGKSRFICTAPGPIGVLPLNGKCRATVERCRYELYPDKKIYFPKQDLLRHVNPMKLAMLNPYCENAAVKIGINAPECCARHYYRWHVNREKDAFWTMVENKEIRTIAIDDGSAIYDDILFAIYGRNNRISADKTAYGPVNQELIELIYSASEKHLIITHQSKDEYKGPTATGRDTVKGFKEIGFHVNVLAEFARDPKKQAFFLNVRMCQDNAALHGDGGMNLLKDDEITFANLAMKIFGDDIDLLEYV